MKRNLFVLLVLLLLVVGCGKKENNKQEEKTTIDTKLVVEGAREYINKRPSYSNEMFEGGYPQDNVGACTDVIWYAYQKAGFSIKDAIDEDISKSPKDYGISKPNPDIDFRRVRNLFIFFNKYAKKLTTSFDNPKEWQAGDIVIFDGYSHIAICSDKLNEDGIPYIFHHSEEKGTVEDNDIYNQKVIAHYRFNSY